jgi:hypothetical protein
MATRVDQLGDTLFLHTKPDLGLRIFGGIMGGLMLLLGCGFFYLILSTPWKYQFDIIRNQTTYLDVRYRVWVVLGLLPVEDQLLQGVRRIEALHEGPALNPVIAFTTGSGPQLVKLPRRWEYQNMEAASTLNQLVRVGGSPSHVHSAEVNSDFIGMWFLIVIWMFAALSFLFMSFGRSFLIADRARRLLFYERRFFGLNWKRSMSFDAILSIEDKWRKTRSRGSEITERLIEIQRQSGRPWRILVDVDHQDDVRILAARIHNFVRGL